MLYEIITYSKKYINQDDAQVLVTFQLPSRDWLKLENSVEWRRIEELLREMKNTHIQMSHSDQKY